jgi:hypothetical protein
VVARGEADPVSRNRPGEGSASTVRRTTSHEVGNRCHSPIRTGCSPVVNRPGSVYEDRTLTSVVQPVDRAGPLQSGAGLADGLRALDSDGSNSGQQLPPSG